MHVRIWVRTRTRTLPHAHAQGEEEEVALCDARSETHVALEHGAHVIEHNENVSWCYINPR